MVTSVDLMKTVARWPASSASSTAASLVIEEVTTWSPPSRRTFTVAMTLPRSTSTIVPGNWLRVDNRMAAPFRHQSTGLDSFEEYRLVRVSRLTMLGVPLRLHRQRREHRQLRVVRIEFAVPLVNVDNDALGVEPVAVLAEVDGVGGFGERKPLPVCGFGLFGDMNEVSADRADTIGVGDRTVPRNDGRRIQGDHRVACGNPIRDRSGPHDRGAADEEQVARE